MRRLDYIAHHGILGQKWGVRRFQNKDGTYTSAGRKRYGVNSDKKETINSAEQRILDHYKSTKFMMNKEDHYYRNRLNTDLPPTMNEAINRGWHTVIANAHQFTKGNDALNVKYVDPSGKREAVYNKNGTLLKTALDMGSYNYCPSEKSYIGHFKYDILPWIRYGNAPDDPSTVGQRINAILGKYRKGAVVLGKQYADQLSEAFDESIDNIIRVGDL